MLRRSVKVSLASFGVRDRRRLAALLEAYRAAVKFFLRLLWREPDARFSTATSERLARTRLSTRYRDQALKQAVEIAASTRKSAKELAIEPRRPEFGGMAILDAKFVRIEPGDREHDLLVHLACLRKGKPLVLRTRRTRVLKKWLAQPGARLVQGCGLTDGDLLTLWVELPAPEKKKEGAVLGVDVGVSKLLATSEGEFLGTDFRIVRDRVRRRRPGSKGRRRARRERDDLIRYWTKRLPWSEVRAVAFEDLAGIKRGKKRGRGRSFRRALAPWTPPLVEHRLRCLAAENGVLAVPVPARGNSTTCPRCSFRSGKNRKRDLFLCVKCEFADDADHVGATAAKRLGEQRLEECAAAWEKECAAAEAKRRRRKAAAKKRGDATAEKWREKRRRQRETQEPLRSKEVETIEEIARHDSSSRGAQSPAARIPRGSAPVRDHACGGAPQNAGGPPPAEENPERGSPRGSRPKAAGRRGEEPPTRDPSRPRGQLPSFDAVGSWPLDEFSDKP